MKAEKFLYKEYGITDRLANLDLETENGIRNHYLTSLMERYAEEEIKNFLKFNKSKFTNDVVEKMFFYFDEFYNVYETENNR